MQMKFAGHRACLNRPEQGMFRLDIRDVFKNIDKGTEVSEELFEAGIVGYLSSFFIVSISFVVN